MVNVIYFTEEIASAAYYIDMFKNKQAFSSFAVKDLDDAEKFYGDTLGMKIDQSEDGEYFNLLINDGGTSIMVYAKPEHKPAQYTIMNFMVQDIEKTVTQLEVNNIDLEIYDNPEMKQDDRGIFRDEDMGMAMAWFCDPAGNIIAALEQK